jgi:glyoxylase-like metal-dependent hydrolase (beta-lactamase superfamily II)
MHVGPYELLSLSDGFFGLDGGAMFGVVPKPLWEKRAPADGRNRIRLGLRPLLIRDGHRHILIDTGIGDKMDAKATDIYALDRTRHLDHALADAGLTAADIDLVVATHLHFDHFGGSTMRQDGRLVPRFPRARYLVPRGDWADATHPHERNRASYLPENFLPLHDAGVLELVDSDLEVLPGVTLVRTGGHAMYHHLVRIEAGGRTACFVADLIPTSAHVDEAWIMGYDLYPMDTLAYKKRFLREAIDREFVIFFEHDPQIAAGIIREVNGRKLVEPISTT